MWSWWGFEYIFYRMVKQVLNQNLVVLWLFGTQRGVHHIYRKVELGPMQLHLQLLSEKADGKLGNLLEKIKKMGQTFWSWFALRIFLICYQPLISWQSLHESSILLVLNDLSIEYPLKAWRFINAGYALDSDPSPVHNVTLLATTHNWGTVDCLLGVATSARYCALYIVQQLHASGFPTIFN